MKFLWMLPLGLVASSCVTPRGVKEVSQRHTVNLLTLGNQVAKYRTAIGAYYQSLQLRQRDAYVAQMVSRDLDQAVLAQIESFSAKPSLPDSVATNLIDTGVRLADQRRFWANHFDFWVSDLQGDSLEAKRASLAERIETTRKAQLAAPAGQATLLAQVLMSLQRTAQETDADLTYASIAIDLKKQQANLYQQLGLLSKQVEVMQAFHGIVDQYLSIDATIDGKKIAEAAEAGAKVDPALLGGVMQAMRGQP